MHRYYGALRKIQEEDDGTITVFGIASTGARDDAGEIILPSALKAAIPDYMTFGAVREMHGSAAAGTAVACYVDDDGNTNLAAHVVDPIAVKKVQTGVYKGLSIGGKVLTRDPSDYTTITAIKLVEISLVDRPCNPEAEIAMWKADGLRQARAPLAEALLEKLAAINARMDAHQAFIDREWAGLTEQSRRSTKH